MAAAAPPPPPPPPHHDPWCKNYGHRASSATRRAVGEFEKTQKTSAAAQIDAAKLPHLNRPSPISHRPTGAVMEAQRREAEAHRRQVADLISSGRVFTPAQKPSPPLSHLPGFGPVPAHPPPVDMYPLAGHAVADAGGFWSPPSGSSRPPRPDEAGPSRPRAPSLLSAVKSMTWEELCRLQGDGMEDHVLDNEFYKRTKPLLPELGMAMKEKEIKKAKMIAPQGRKPRLGKEEDETVPKRFSVEVTELEMHALIIPKTITPLLVQKFKLKKHKNKRDKKGETEPKLCIPLRTTKCCPFYVQLRWFDGHLVIFQGWEEFARAINLEKGDLIFLEFDGDGFRVLLCKQANSTQHVFFCDVHHRY